MVAKVRGSVQKRVVDGKTYWYSKEPIGTGSKWWYIGPDTRRLGTYCNAGALLHKSDEGFTA
jgi:hypothetical protein